MKKNKLTLVEIIAIIIIIFVIVFFGITSIRNNNKKNENNKLLEFENSLINSASLYLADNKDIFPNFENVGDVALIPIKELIENNYVDVNMDNPTGKELTDFYVRAIINKDKTILYEVSG